MRTTGERPAFLHVDDASAAAAAAAGRELARAPGDKVAVIGAADQVSELGAALRAAGVPFGEASRRGLLDDVTLVAVEVVKGLEFDAVVVVEPARIVSRSPQGLRALFVALTRATKRMTVVHAEELPAPMR